MESVSKKIYVEVLIQAPLETVWECWTQPEHIIRWNQATTEWHCPRASIDLRPGGHFVYRMEARDGSIGFDFGGTFLEVVPMERISFRLNDSREVTIQFTQQGKQSHILEAFDPEQINPHELQLAGWHAILVSFKKHAEAQQL